jgi:hypothetical protein
MVLQRNRIILYLRRIILSRNRIILRRRHFILSGNGIVPLRRRIVLLCNGIILSGIRITLRRRRMVPSGIRTIPASIRTSLRLTFFPKKSSAMAKWNQSTWNSGALWGPAPTPAPNLSNNPRKRKTDMKRQPYFPRLVDARPGWFGNFATELPGANAALTIPAAEVTSIINDALYAQAICGAHLTKVREFGPATTSAIDTLLDGEGAAPFAPPVFAPPALPAGVTPVPPGVLRRIAKFVQLIKSRPGYTEAIGLQLGIVGSEDAAEHPVPEFTVKVERGGDPGNCECVRIVFKKFGRQGVVVWSKRGGGAWEMLGIDSASPYLDGRPLLVPGTPELREYRLQYYDDAAPVGDFTPVQTVTVTP